MKKLLQLIFLTLLIFSCRKSDEKPTNTEIGSSLVDLTAVETVIRKKESLLANFVCDALKESFEGKGEVIDFVLINAGNIRYNSQLRPDGIYKKEMLTAEMMDEILPFQNSSSIVQLTGSEIKIILERAVAQYPIAKGPFMQCSSGFSFRIDTLANPQLLNIDETVIQTNGQRIELMTLNGVTIVPTNIYKVLLSDYIAEGNDGFVTLKYLNLSLKRYFEDNQSSALKDYVLLNSPINPQLEGRIIFK